MKKSVGTKWWFWGGGALALFGCSGAPIEGGEEGLASDEQAVIGGNADFTGKEFQQRHTVQLRTPLGTVCSGTLVLPNVVMTARHCVTTNGAIGGTLATPAAVRARLLGAPSAPVPPPASDPCVGSGRDVSCSVGAAIKERDVALDLVFVRLAAPLILDGDRTLFTPIELSSDDGFYAGKDLLLSGWGNDSCGGGAGTLRWGSGTITSIDRTATQPGGAQYLHGLELSPHPVQGVYAGDAGAPIWGTRTYPPAALGVASIGSCDPATAASNTLGVDAAGASFHAQVAANLTDVRKMLLAAAAFTDSVDFLHDMSVLHVVDLNPSDAKPNWTLQNNQLTELANAGPSVVLVHDEVEQRALGGVFGLQVRSDDNDRTGVVFSYVDPQNYMACEVDVTSQRLETVLVRGGVRSVLDSKIWKLDFKVSTLISVSLLPGINGIAFPVQCSVSRNDGASPPVQTSPVASDVLPAGRVGIYNEWLQGATYTSFVVSQPVPQQ